MSRPRSLFVLVAIGGALACSKAPPPSTDDGPRPPKPADQLAPNELPEGKDKAFGMVLPRGMKIVSAFSDRTIVEGEVTAEALANYVRGRVEGGKSTVGASQTLFEQVKIPAQPARRFDISIERTQGGRAARMVMRDSTPAPPSSADPADRMKAAGLTPDGRLADPKHMK